MDFDHKKFNRSLIILPFQFATSFVASASVNFIVLEDCQLLRILRELISPKTLLLETSTTPSNLIGEDFTNLF